MSRENAASKGRRLLTEGRLRVLEVDEHGGTASAECRGDSGAMYALGRDDERGWFCNCAAKTTCSHLRALQLVVVLEPRRSAA